MIKIIQPPNHYDHNLYNSFELFTFIRRLCFKTIILVINVVCSCFHVPPWPSWTQNYLGLVSLAFAGSLGMTLVILACALYGLWWPFFVVLFYVLSPIPTMIARRHTDVAGGTNSPCMETAVFITMGFLVSSFALPIVLYRKELIQAGACYLSLAGNVVVYLTILGFFTIFDTDDSDYAMW